jgi:hypothetical protein
VGIKVSSKLLKSIQMLKKFWEGERIQRIAHYYKKDLKV